MASVSTPLSWSRTHDRHSTCFSAHHPPSTKREKLRGLRLRRRRGPNPHTPSANAAVAADRTEKESSGKTCEPRSTAETGPARSGKLPATKLVTGDHQGLSLTLV